MHYILDEHVSLCGFWGVPYAIYDSRVKQTSFFNLQRFLLLLKCDGEHDFDKLALTDEDQKFLESALACKVIRACSPDERLEPSQEYHNYDVKYRDDVQLSITGLCNYKCRHCFQGAPHGKLGTISFDALMNIADQMSACGIRKVSLTGGEPLFRDDFWDVFDGITARGIYIENVFTNGGLLDEKWIAELDRRVANGVERPTITVSFDGVGWHDWLRGVDGAEEAALHAMRLGLDHGYGVSSAMSMHRHNTKTLRKTVNLLAGMGISSLKVNIARPEGEWVRETENCLSTTEGWEAYLDYIPHYFEDGAPMRLMLEGCFNCGGRTLSWNAVNEKSSRPGWEKIPSCSSLRKHFYISPQGAVVPCMSMAGTPVETNFPNINETPLHDILQPGTSFITKSETTARQIGDANDECRECQFLPKCWGGCRACGSVFGDFYEAYDKTACEWFKGNWRSRFEEAVQKGIELMDPQDRAVCEAQQRLDEEHDRMVRIRLGFEQPEDIPAC